MLSGVYGMTEENKAADSHGQQQAAELDVQSGEVVEEEVVEGARVRRKGIYLLPNALTTASLFSGFYAIVSAANGMFENAAVAIFVSMILDGLDGRVARMTHTQRKLGEEYDSLADMVAFGVRSEEHTSELQSRPHLVCRLLLEKKKKD